MRAGNRVGANEGVHFGALDSDLLRFTISAICANIGPHSLRLSTWLFDNVSYIIPGGLAVLMCYVFNVSEFVDTNNHRINAL